MISTFEKQTTEKRKRGDRERERKKERKRKENTPSHNSDNDEPSKVSRILLYYSIDTPVGELHVEVVSGRTMHLPIGDAGAGVVIAIGVGVGVEGCAV